MRVSHCVQYSPTLKRQPKMIRSTICLNMIVKNEIAVIARCLESVKSFIDYWVIVDTGSTDGTQAMIQSIMQDIPGELHERPWRDFGFNRTEAAELARGKVVVALTFVDERLTAGRCDG